MTVFFRYYYVCITLYIPLNITAGDKYVIKYMVGNNNKKNKKIKHLCV